MSGPISFISRAPNMKSFNGFIKSTLDTGWSPLLTYLQDFTQMDHVILAQSLSIYVEQRH